MFVFAVAVCACGSLFDGLALNLAVVREVASFAFVAVACLEVSACVVCRDVPTHVVFIVGPSAGISMCACSFECMVDASGVFFKGWGWLLDSINHVRFMYVFAVRGVANAFSSVIAVHLAVIWMM